MCCLNSLLRYKGVFERVWCCKGDNSVSYLVMMKFKEIYMNSRLLFTDNCLNSPKTRMQSSIRFNIYQHYYFLSINLTLMREKQLVKDILKKYLWNFWFNLFGKEQFQRGYSENKINVVILTNTYRYVWLKKCYEN